MKKVIYLLVLLCITNCYAHKDFITTKKFGTVTIHFVTGYQYEEINKSLLIGQYAESLANSLGFKDSLTIIFGHSYTSQDEKTNFRAVKTKTKGGNNYLVQYDKSIFDFYETLNILEAIYKKDLKKLNKDFLSIEKKEPSDLVKRVLSKKVYRPDYVNELASKNFISYYMQDGKYHVYALKDGKEVDYLIVNSIYQMVDFNAESCLIFDSKNSFYYININRTDEAVRTIFNSENIYKPYRIIPELKDFFSIEMSNFRGEKDYIKFNYVSLKIVD